MAVKPSAEATIHSAPWTLGARRCGAGPSVITGVLPGSGGYGLQIVGRRPLD